jgi:hypothetical protein
MREHLFECCVLLSNHTRFVEQVFLRLAELCESTIDQGAEKMLAFTDGYATARAVEGGLLIRVGATNLVSSHAIRVALESSIRDIAGSAPGKIAWHSAEKTRLARRNEHRKTNINARN